MGVLLAVAVAVVAIFLCRERIHDLLTTTNSRGFRETTNVNNDVSIDNESDNDVFAHPPRATFLPPIVDQPIGMAVVNKPVPWLEAPLPDIVRGGNNDLRRRLSSV